MRLIVGNSTLVEIDGLHDKMANAYVDDAVATVSVYIPGTDGNPNTPVENAVDVPLDYVADSEGGYRGVIQDAVFVADLVYLVIVAAVMPDGSTFQRGYNVRATIA